MPHWHMAMSICLYGCQPGSCWCTCRTTRCCLHVQVPCKSACGLSVPVMLPPTSYRELVPGPAALLAALSRPLPQAICGIAVVLLPILLI
jgi:hypothetical protein